MAKTYYVDEVTGTTCPYCGGACELVSGKVLHPRKRKAWRTNYWRCDPCDAHVACQPASPKHGLNGTEAMGRPAKKHLRWLRHCAHEAFDPLWQPDSPDKRFPQRKAAYNWLARRMGLHPDDCHIGLMDEPQCQQVIELANEMRTIHAVGN